MNWLMLRYEHAGGMQTFGDYQMTNITNTSNFDRALFARHCESFARACLSRSINLESCAEEGVRVWLFTKNGVSCAVRLLKNAGLIAYCGGGAVASAELLSSWCDHHGVQSITAPAFAEVVDADLFYTSSNAKLAAELVPYIGLSASAKCLGVPFDIEDYVELCEFAVYSPVGGRLKGHNRNKAYSAYFWKFLVKEGNEFQHIPYALRIYSNYEDMKGSYLDAELESQPAAYKAQTRNPSYKPMAQRFKDSMCSTREFVDIDGYAYSVKISGFESAGQVSSPVKEAAPSKLYYAKILADFAHHFAADAVLYGSASENLCREANSIIHYPACPKILVAKVRTNQGKSVLITKSEYGWTLRELSAAPKKVYIFTQTPRTFS